MDNLLLTKESPPDVRVYDFGLANIRSLSSSSKNLCQTIIGTEDYSAPEVILGKQYDGMKADMWSAGVLLFTMVAGYCPFRGVDTQEIFESVVNCRYSFPRQFPQLFQAVVAKLLVVNPRMRPSAEALLESVFDSPPSSLKINSLLGLDVLSTARREPQMSHGTYLDKFSIPELLNVPLESSSNNEWTCMRKSPISSSNYCFSQLSPVISLGSVSNPISKDVRDQEIPTRTLRNVRIQNSGLPKFSELYLAMREESNGISVMDRRYRFRVYRKCFIGSEAVTWIVRNRKCSRLEAVSLGQQLMDANIFCHVCNNHTFKDDFLFYRFREDDPGNSKVLNRRLTWPKFDYGRRPTVVSVELLSEIIDICRKHQACDSSLEIDFIGLQLDERYSAFRNATAELQAVKMSEISEEREKVAFIVNCHNMLWMHARVELGPATEAVSETAYSAMIIKLQYDIGGVTFSLEDLRNICNSAQLLDARRSLGSNFEIAQHSSKVARNTSHFWRNFLHPGDDGIPIMLVPQVWHPLIVFVMSDSSRGSPQVVPLMAEDINLTGLRNLAMRHIKTQLCESEYSNFSAIQAFLDGLAGDDTEHRTTEILYWIDHIISEWPTEVVTWKVLQLKQLIKGANMCQSYSATTANNSSFAPAL